MTPAEHLRLFPVWLLLGPRQAGKSSLLHKCTSGHAYVNLDDLATQGGFVLHGFLNPPNEITAGLDILPAL